MSTSQPANSRSSNRKRDASAAGMGPPGKEGTKKKTKLDIALETKLTELKEALQPYWLHPSWKPYESAFFMEEMRNLGLQINALTAQTVGAYISDGRLDACLDMLGELQERLKEEFPSTDPQQAKRATTARQNMNKYAERIRTHLNALVDQAGVKPSPHDFASSKRWRVFQERSDAILCLRPADKRGLPISLMHAAFCHFTYHIHDPTMDEHTPKYLNMAEDLCREMPSAFDNEPDRRRAFEKIFVPLDEKLDQHIEFSLEAKVSTAKETGDRPDVAKTVKYNGGNLVLLLEEFKMESDGDVYMQICRAYEVLCTDKKNKHLLKFGNPVFLLCVLGPYLMVCGAIYHENAHIEPLTPLLPMFPEIGIEGRPAKIAHCLRALKEGLDAIQEFWQRAGILDNTNRKATTDKLSEPYLVFNCPDNDLLRFEEWQGTFESLMPDRNKIDKPPTDESPRFLAKIHKAGDKHQYQVVVKFVYNHSGVYGTDVHQYLSDNELAPTLHWTKNLHRGLVMVVMKHLQLEKDIGGSVELDAFKGKLGTRASAVRKELEKIIRLLQAKRMVHADLRPKNIMVKVDGNGDIITGTEEPFLSVIDFDWSGTVGEVCYPPFLNSRIRWPDGAKAYQKIGEKDDSILLENWWDAFEKGQPANEKGEPAKFDASS